MKNLSLPAKYNKNKSLSFKRLSLILFKLIMQTSKETEPRVVWWHRYVIQHFGWLKHEDLSSKPAYPTKLRLCLKTKVTKLSLNNNKTFTCKVKAVICPRTQSSILIALSLKFVYMLSTSFLFIR